MFHNLLQFLVNLLQTLQMLSQPKLTLSQLRLQPEQLSVLKSLSPPQLKVVSDVCDHVVLTSHKKESRQAAVRLKEHLLSLIKGSPTAVDE